MYRKREKNNHQYTQKRGKNTHKYTPKKEKKKSANVYKKRDKISINTHKNREKIPSIDTKKGEKYTQIHTNLFLHLKAEFRIPALLWECFLGSAEVGEAGEVNAQHVLCPRDCP